MKKQYLFISFFFWSFLLLGQQENSFLNFEWNDSTGELILDVPDNFIGKPFLYVNGLTAGVGSNDIGLDRGQLGDQRMVYFYKSGKKLLLIQDNLKFRAISNNEEEKRAVDEAFAKSVIWGFTVKEKQGKVNKINLEGFLLRDAHQVVATLKNSKQGSFKVDKTKSSIYKEGVLGFPNNVEFESIITYVGEGKGDFIQSVSPDPNIVSVRQHHSFIKLPDSNYKPREFKSECGYIYTSFYDYATPIQSDINKRYITRHRLEKKNPGQAKSEPIEPIVYYLDRGCPEPIRSALIDGAKWWNEAFEEAGFINAFQVKDLPSDAHPLDVRYNLIQWVHRSTRGWSYGASIRDPRTGEILKGHVSLGSLRVRQDYLIAQGIASSFDETKDDPRMLEMALARLRQLSAHEIGHTIGLTHNFAASYNDRASVMDYPHPLITLDNNTLDFTKAYDVGIGEWDKRAINYGYSYATENESKYLEDLINRNKRDGYLFISDSDARPNGGLHPFAHLWDNGADPIGELERISKLRKHTIDNMGSGSINYGQVYSDLEKVLVPAYLMHRYQIEAVSKILGGIDFTYEAKTNSRYDGISQLDENLQAKALDVLLSTLAVDFLKLPDNLLKLIPPPAYGYNRDRETFKGQSGSLFDPLAAAEASANHTLNFLLHPERLTRIYQHNDENLNLVKYLNRISDFIATQFNIDQSYGLMLHKLYYIHLIKLSAMSKINKQVSALAIFYATHSLGQLTVKNTNDVSDQIMIQAHQLYLMNILEDFKKNPDVLKLPELPDLPPGSPIGCH